VFIIKGSGDAIGRKYGRAYLLMSIAKLVFEYCFAVTQKLDFICKDVECICQSLGKHLRVEIIKWHVASLDGGFFGEVWRLHEDKVKAKSKGAKVARHDGSGG
jgi:hypothetical protein